MLKIFHSQAKSVTSAAIIIAGASLLSRLMGVVRDRALAHYFNTGPVADAYFAAFKIPDLIFNLLVAGALTAGFIPIFTKLLNPDNETDSPAAWRLANNVLNILVVALTSICVLGMIFVKPLTHLIAPGFTPENFALAASFTRIMFLSPLLLGISMIMGGILQSLRRFVLYSFAPVLYNFGIIIGITILVKYFGVIGLPWGVVLGAFLHCSIQIYGAWKSGWRWQKVFDWSDRNTILVGKLMIPRTLGLAITQFNQLITTILASLLPAGSLAVYSYANNLQSLPTGIIAIPFAMAVFPVLSATAAQKNNHAFVDNLSTTIRQILFLTVPAAILILLLRAQIVRVVLGSGTFDWDSTKATANALAFFSLGLIAQALIPLLARGFYALSNTKTPFVIGVIAELISIIAALLLMKPLGASGLALATTVGATINTVLLLLYIRQTTKTLDGGKIIFSLLRIMAAAMAMALAVQGLKYPLAKIFNQDYFWGIFGQGLVAGLTGIVVYGIICHILKVPEFVIFKDSFAKRWLKLKIRNSPPVDMDNL